MKKFYTLLLALMACTLTGVAQIVTTSPSILQESSPNVVLTYHADQGDKGLMGLPSSTPIYAHIGVITNKSNSQWSHVIADWGVNVEKNTLKYVSANTYTLTIGDMRTYFGITDASEHIQKIAIVFRDATGAKSGRAVGGGDIYVDVAEDGFAMQFTCDAENLVVSKATTVKFSAVTTEAANITITVNGNQITTVSNATTAEATYNLSSTGSYAFVATANNGKETISKTINMMYPTQSKAGTYPGGVPKMGAVKNNDGTVTFCLAAPGKSSVILVPSWDDYQLLDKNTMLYQDYQGYRYFFTTVSGLKDDVYYPYYFIVDGQYKVADPYARLVLDSYSDKWIDGGVWDSRPMYPYERFEDTMLAVYRGDMDTDFKFDPFTIPDHSNLVIYEMLIRDFTGDEGQANGNGTYRKALAKLDYLKQLGVNAVELMPVMEFNGNNSWGYNTNFYFAPDKAYGSPTDLKNFVNECHKRGMAVILDIVFNQTDGLHPWYIMYGGYNNVANNPFYNATAPHDYSVLNDWKQEHPLVLQQEKDALKHWMTVYNVDGFRFDLVKGLGTSYNGNTDGYNASRVARMKELHATIKSVKPNGIHINENLAGAQEENEMANDGQLNWANINYASCQFAMGYGDGANTSRFNASNDSRNWGSTVSYAESHDEERMAYKQLQYGASGVKGNHVNSMKRLGQVAVQMLMMPGPKMIWQFGELGADQTEKTSIGNDVDPKKVIWSYLDDPDRKALHDTYMELNYFRTHNPELFSNTATMTQTNLTSSSLTNARTIRLVNGDREAIAFINGATGGTNKSVSCTATKLGSNNFQLVTASKDFNGTLSGNAGGTGGTVSSSIPPHGYAVFATKNISGVDNVIGDVDSSSLIMVIGGQGEIEIVGEYEYAVIYDLSGRVQSSNTGLTPGVYIVNVDGTSHKVRVN